MFVRQFVHTILQPTHGSWCVALMTRNWKSIACILRTVVFSHPTLGICSCAPSVRPPIRKSSCISCIRSNYAGPAHADRYWSWSNTFSRIIGTGTFSFHPFRCHSVKRSLRLNWMHHIRWNCSRFFPALWPHRRSPWIRWIPFRWRMHRPDSKLNCCHNWMPRYRSPHPISNWMHWLDLNRDNMQRPQCTDTHRSIHTTMAWLWF